ncbi:potassium channel family protein [Immundisolibacter sp.]|uniref:potassium channel family protein n=1 Tax=Immundisolibacter sp. TaxID=1934948 RepID=UPI003566B627
MGCVLFHYEALRLIGSAAVAVRQHRRAVLVIIFGVVATHVVEILVYAFAMYLGHRLGLGTFVGEPHPQAAQYVYFSAETFTTLGLGDIYPTGSLRLIASLEPLIGMLLIGWSGSYTYLAVQRYWLDMNAPAPRALDHSKSARTCKRPRPVTHLDRAASSKQHTPGAIVDDEIEAPSSRGNSPR